MALHWGNYLITINNSKSIHTNCFPCKSLEDSSAFSNYWFFLVITYAVKMQYFPRIYCILLDGQDFNIKQSNFPFLSPPKCFLKSKIQGSWRWCNRFWAEMFQFKINKWPPLTLCSPPWPFLLHTHTHTLKGKKGNNLRFFAFVEIKNWKAK